MSQDYTEAVKRGGKWEGFYGHKGTAVSVGIFTTKRQAHEAALLGLAVEVIEQAEDGYIPVWVTRIIEQSQGTGRKG